jgi:OOP family OmpA-OmpF porin
MRLKLFGVFLMALILAAPAWSADYVRKVDNFLILVDTSGSMYDSFQKGPQSKVAHAAALLARMNKEIPELGYLGGLYTAAPFRELQVLSPFAQKTYGEAVTKVPAQCTSLQCVWPTPLGVGLAALEPAIKSVSGRTAVIILSDGMENQGPATLPIAKMLAEKYGVCFHVISYADKASGQALLDAIASLKDCSVTARAAQLDDPAALATFVRDVFYEMGDGDDDMDGVPNSKDKCPGTPMDLAVDADGCPIPLSVTLKVFFDFDKWDIKPQYHQELANFATFMKEYPGVKVEIDGHTDSIGSEKYNQKLSQRRAEAVRMYLVQKLGMNPSMLTAVGFGESKPIASNDTEEGRAKNRRIEAVLDGVYKKR